MTAQIIIACTIGAFIGSAFSFALFAIIERVMKPRKPVTSMENLNDVF
jgi:hypothetical protein